MSIEIKGLDNILNSLDELIDENKIETGLGKACAIVEADAKKKAPKMSGELRRSITSKVEGLEGVIYSPLEYAPYVEYGTGLFAEKGGRLDTPWFYTDDKGDWHKTSGMNPQPYMRPALNENREKIVRVIKECISNG